jgi:hypothetical protein
VNIMRRASCLLLALLVGPILAVDPPGNVEQIIEQLGKADPKARVAARLALEKLGPEALPALRKALTHRDAEIRKRVGEVLPGLEQSVLVAPKIVSLKAEKKSARDLLNLLARETGYQIDVWNDNPKEVFTLDLQKVPFWKAVDEIGRLSGLNPLVGYGDERLRFQKEQGIPEHIAYDGAFRFVPTSFQHSRTITLPRVGEPGRPPERLETLTMAYVLHAEPKLPMLSAGEAQLLAAVDSEGNSMMPLPQAVSEEEGKRQIMQRTARYGNGYLATSLNGSLTLGRPSPKARGIKLFHASIPVTLLVEQKPEVVTDKILDQKNKKIVVGTTTFLIESCERTPEKQYRLKMSVTEDKLEGNDYTWMNSLYRRIELQDEKGNRYHNQGSSWSHSTPNHVQVTFNYGSAGADFGPPRKMTYQVWKTMPHSVNVEMRDLPLP